MSLARVIHCVKSVRILSYVGLNTERYGVCNHCNSNNKKKTSKCIFCYNTVNKRKYTRPVILLKNRLWHRCFPVDFAKFLRTPYLQNATGGCF